MTFVIGQRDVTSSALFCKERYKPSSLDACFSGETWQDQTELEEKSNSGANA